MENRLCLNKRPAYELPDNTVIQIYCNNYNYPDFEPNICITSFGRLRIKKKYETAKQLWIKTDNKKLIDFIEKYDFEEYMKNTLVRKDGNKYNLSATTLKKILLEEFYGVKYGK